MGLLDTLSRAAENPAVEEEANLLAQKSNELNNPALQDAMYKLKQENPNASFNRPVSELEHTNAEDLGNPNKDNVDLTPGTQEQKTLPDQSQEPVAMGDDTTQVSSKEAPKTPQEARESLRDDHDIMAEKIYPDGSPETKSAIAQWMRQNPGKTAAGGVALGAGALALSGGKNSQAPQQGGKPPQGPTDKNMMASNSQVSFPKKEQEKASQQEAEESTVPESHETSGIKPISNDVAAPGQLKTSSLHDAAPSTINTVENMQQAQNADQFGRLANQLGRASELIGTGISHADPVAQKIFDEQSKEGINVKNFEQLAEQEKNDPNSQVSSDFRDYAKRFGITLPSSTSAVNAEKVMPYAFKQFEATQAQQAKSQDLKYKYQELATLKQLGSQQKGQADQGKNDIKQMSDLGKITKEMNPGTASSRSPLGQSTIILNKADRIDALLDQMNKAQSGGSPQQAKEAARQLDSLLSGGMGTVSGSHDLFARTGAQDVSNFLQYVTNSPQGSNNQDFIKQMKDTVDRERNVAKKQQQDFLSATAMGNAERFKTGKTADTWKKITSHANLDEDGNPMVPGQQGTAPQTSGLVKIKDTTTGRIKAVDAATADQILQNPKYQKAD